MVVDASVIVSRLVPHDAHHLRLPALRLVAVDDPLARSAAGLAARLRVRGVDALYIATAANLGLPLVTWDVEQRERAASVVEVTVPEASG